VKTGNKYIVKELPGFSPYTKGNKTKSVKLLILHWQKELIIDFHGSETVTECQLPGFKRGDYTGKVPPCKPGLVGRLPILQPKTILA